MSEPRTIAYLFTTFPKSTETFLQREVSAVRAQGLNLRIYSLIGGGGTFRGIRIERFSMWRLLTLFWLIPYEAGRRPEVLKELLHGLFTRRAPSWLNFWENMLGAGFACVYARHFRRERPALVHAAWAGGPATAAWILWRLDGHRYSVAAHAYDLFEHGGDWWLNEKLADGLFVHTSTGMGRNRLIERGVPPDRVAFIRRGLESLPRFKPLRSERSSLRLIAVARLVEKKGLDRQLHIYAALQKAGVSFSARIAGEGPLRGELERLAGRLGIAAQVSFLGEIPHHEVWDQLAWADALLHTGVVAPSGDRDGLPNVIPEAMAAGTLVITSAAAATTEAIEDGVSGWVAGVETPEQWVRILSQISRDDELAERIRARARAWVEENFDAHRNARRLVERFEAAFAVTGA